MKGRKELCVCVWVGHLYRRPSANTLILSLRSLRNASGLTPADLAHAQGFQECAQLLSNAQNQQLSQLNGFSTHNSTGVLNGGHQLNQGRSFLNGAPSRKRSLDCIEPSHFKKARTSGRSRQFNYELINILVLYKRNNSLNKIIRTKHVLKNSRDSHYYKCNIM